MNANKQSLLDIISECSCSNDVIDYIIKDYQYLLDKSTEPLHDNDEYMKLVELYFLLKNLRELMDIHLYKSPLKADILVYNHKDSDTKSPLPSWPQRSMLDRNKLIAMIRSLDIILLSLVSYIEERTLLVKEDGEISQLDNIIHYPRLLRLCQKYKLTKNETKLFQIMTVTQGSQNSHVLNSLIEDDYYRRISGFQRLTGISDVEIDEFCDAERIHMKEGLILVDEDNYNGGRMNLRLQRVAVQLMYGRKVKSDDFLKISQTSLEDIIAKETNEDVEITGPLDPTHLTKDSSSVGNNNNEMEEDDYDQDTSFASESFENQESITWIESNETNDNNITNKIENNQEPGVVLTKKRPRLSNNIIPLNDIPKDLSCVPVVLKPEGTTTSSSNHTLIGIKSNMSSNKLIACNLINASDSALLPYTENSQLDFLEDSFQMIALMIKGNVARLKDHMKKEGTTSRYSSLTETDMKHSERELTAKLKLQENRIEIRLNKTKEAGYILPRLELLNQRFHLDSFEKKIIILLIGKTVSPIIKTLMESLDNSRVSDDVLTIGQALSILCPDFHSQIIHRKYFYRSSCLLSNAFISLAKSKWNVGSGDLTENRITLDRRILDWVVGLDSEINELVEGSDLYEPQVDLSQVVLPPGYIDTILSQCSSYDLFQKYRLQIGLDRTISYGNSLVILLCGKSGTGKTMTVNAIAHELKKKVLLVDFNNLMNKKDTGRDLEVDLKGLFRESKMSNTVLFFDECENIFKSRSLGSEQLLNSLLTEIERHEGIVFLATNRPYEIDEAMHRRITMVLEYAAPDYSMRKRIWDNLLGTSCSSDTNPLDKNINNDNNSNNNDNNNNSSSNQTMDLISVSNVHNQDYNSKNFLPLLSTENKQIKVTSNIKKNLLPLACDVNTAELAIRYELTGGFIKNAVLSSLLSALSRNATEPIITQSDLIAGCKLQMRGNLTIRNFKDQIPKCRGLKDLYLSREHREQLQKILRYEAARPKVYGDWSMEYSNKNQDNIISSTTTSSVVVVTESNKEYCEQRACINLFAGTRGSGKSTIANAVSYELSGKRSKYIHVSDFLSFTLAEIVSTFKTLIHDARIMDAMIIIDGFEHLMDDSAESTPHNGSKLNVILSRVIEILHSFHGCVILLCHIENPQNITLQRDFATSLYSFIRFTIADYDIRSMIWKALIPPGSISTKPGKSSDINYEQLGRKFEINPGSIRAAVANALAEAAMRSSTTSTTKTAYNSSISTSSSNTSIMASSSSIVMNKNEDDNYVTQKDLLLAGEEELNKLKGARFDLTSRLFT